MKTKGIIIYFSIISLSIFALIACNQKSSPQPVAGTGSGNLSGYIYAYDDKTSPISDLSGFTVSVDDINNTSVKTDASGKYNFTNLIYGIHDLTFSKTGYGNFKLFGVNHSKTSTSGNTILRGINLGKISTTSITGIKISTEPSGILPALRIMPELSPVPTASNRGYFRLFFGSNNNVSNTNYKAYTKVAGILNANAGPLLSKEDFAEMGFSSGQTIYVKAYGDSFNSNEYTDPNTGITIFPNLNATTVNAVAIKVP
jgi:hypothetical protein